MKNSSALQINEDIKKNWEVVQQKLKETYGLDVYKSWIQNVEAKGIDFSSLINLQTLINFLKPDKFLVFVYLNYFL